MAWLVLIVAGLLEIVWSLALKRSEGLSRPVWALIGLGVALVSLGMLTYALRDLPVGTAYAVWVGIGAVGVATAGMVFLRETVSPARLLCLAAVISGVVGLSLTGS